VKIAHQISNKGLFGLEEIGEREEGKIEIEKRGAISLVWNGREKE
jgi:hypothetical protein